MTAAAESRARVSSSFVHVHEGAALNAARLLRMFDDARRALCSQVARQEGTGAGYDSLRVEWPAIAAVDRGDVVTVTALLSAERAPGHQVDYLATATGSRGPCAVLAQAHGWTLLARQQTTFTAEGDSRNEEGIHG